jgi:ADP-heptose:LPS heptosyltransferase/glycosyltransferase involved in cell wall biosynthesis
MSEGPSDGSEAPTSDVIPRSARFRPGGSGPPPTPKPAELRFLPAADAPGTDRDVLIGYQIFLGRDPENSFVIANARASPVHGMVRGWITSEEFTGAVLGPLDAGRPLPHEQASAGPDAGQTEWLLRHLALDAIGHAGVRDAATWRDLLHVLVGLPGFPRPHAAAGGAAAAAGAAGEEQPGFILITIEQPRPGEALPGSRVEGAGWVIAPADVTEVSVHCGGAMLTQARFGLPRPDVARRFPHYRMVDRCGFAFSADLPASIAPGQPPLLTVQVRTADGELGRKGVRVRQPGADSGGPQAQERARPKRPAAARTVALRDATAAASPVLVLIDTPAPDGDAARVPADQALVISGWAVALSGVADVTLFCDGQTLGTAHVGIRRPDLATAFAEYPGALLGGWTLVVPAGTLAAGGHRLRVVAAGADGASAEQGVSIWVEAETAAAVRATMPAAEAAFGMRMLSRQARHFSILLLNADDDTAALAATLASLKRQVYGAWTATVVASDQRALAAAQSLPEAAGLNGRLHMATPAGLADAPVADPSAMLMKLRAGDVLGCDALLEFALAAKVSPDADFTYADEIGIDPVLGRAMPSYKLDFAPEMLLGTNYLGRAWCASAGLPSAAGLSVADVATAADYDLVLRLTEAARHVAHTPRMLLARGPAGDTLEDEAAALGAAAARRGLAAEILPGALPGLWRVQRALPDAPRVSIVMPTCGARGLVRRAIQSIHDTCSAEGAADVEIVVIDDLPAADKRTRTWLRKHADVIIKAEGAFNWSRFNNLGATAASGDVLLFLNDDIELTAPGWLAPMLEQVLRPEAGVVGGRLLYPDGRVQHAGLYLAEGHGRHAFRFAEPGDLGPFGIGGVAREVAAVTGACLMVRRDLFERLGGFDEAHSVINNDMDFCLRARAAGHAVIYTPHASMIHHELASRASVEDSYDSGRFADAFRAEFAAGDPYRNVRHAPHADQYAPEDEPAVFVHAGKAGPKRDEVRHILALKLDHIGDFMTALPALRLLKTRFPKAKLTLLAPEASLALARRETAIDEFVKFGFFHARSTLGPRDVSPAELAELQALLEPRAFDLAIDLRMQPQTRPVLRHTGAKMLAGYDHDGRFPWLDIALEWEGDRKLQRKRAPVAERLVQLVEAAAAAFDEPADKNGPNRPPPSALPAEAVMALLPPAFAGRRLVCVHPDVGNPLRRWPAAHFAALIDLLAIREHCAAVLIGSEDETGVAEEVLRRVAPETPVLSLAGKLPLGELPTLLQACALFVGNNSGPQHVAAGFGVPTVGVHAGITDAREWGPSGPFSVAVQRRMSCGPCYIEFADECPREFACLTGLRPRDVYEACRLLLAAGAPAATPPGEDGEAPLPETLENTVLSPADARRAEAEAMARLALQAGTEGPQGYIETVATGDGAIWLMGWMKSGHALEFAGAIADLFEGGGQHAVVVSAMSYSRADLPLGARGIIGRADGAWQPTLKDGEAEDFSLFFGPGGRFHMRCHRPLRMLGLAELAAEYQGFLARGMTGQQPPSIQRMLGALESWTPTKPGAAWMGTETSVDRILLVPGLGAFIEGWVLSPLRRVQDLRMRIGGVVMALHPHTLTWKPRPDLISAYPASEAMAAHAGFVGLFESPEALSDYAEPVLKIVFEGGASVNFPIPPKLFRRLGQSARLEDARKFFPALEEEAFFPAFARAAARAERAAVIPAAPVQVAEAERVLVMVLPPERCDLFLLFTAAARQARVAAGAWGIVFLASAGAGRSDALWLFRDFTRDMPGVAASLLTIAEPSQAFASLPDVLATVGARHFVFVADSVFLSDEGWAMVPGALEAVALEAEGAAPLFFGDERDGLGARCFAWSTERLARWSATSAAALGGIHPGHGLPAQSPVLGTAWSSRPLVRTGLQAAVNRVLAGGPA